MEERKIFIENNAGECIGQNSNAENNRNIFDPRGKLKRKGFIFTFLSFYFLAIFTTAYGHKHDVNLFIGLFLPLFFVLSYFFATIKRLRDVGWSTWFSILLLLPIINLCLMLVLAFKGSKNTYEIKKYALEDLKESIFSFSTISFQISYLALGALQFFATWAGMFKLCHNNFIIVFFVSSFVSFIPLVGTGFGIYGAHTGWGWNLFASILLFVGPYLLIGGVVLIAVIIGLFEDWSKKKNYEKIS